MITRKQEVWMQTVLPDGQTLSGPVEGTNTRNIQSKVQAAIRTLTIQHNLEEGAVITIRIAKAEVDEFANPER